VSVRFLMIVVRCHPVMRVLTCAVEYLPLREAATLRAMGRPFSTATPSGVKSQSTLGSALRRLSTRLLLSNALTIRLLANLTASVNGVAVYEMSDLCDQQ
jgi:hypothetical protein